MCTHWNSDHQTRLVSDTQIVNMRALENGAQVQQVSKMFGSLSYAVNHSFLCSRSPSHLHVSSMQAVLPPRREVLVFGTGGTFFQVDILHSRY
jgi:hypothetical protein